MAELNHVPHLGPDVVLENVGDDVLAFDGETLTHLTGAAAAVSRAVDGIRSVADLNRALGTDVTEALDLLVEHGLVNLEGPSPGRHYRRPDHVGACVDGDRVVLLDLATGDRHVLEGGGSTIWELVTSGLSLSSAIDELEQRLSRLRGGRGGHPAGRAARGSRTAGGNDYVALTDRAFLAIRLVETTDSPLTWARPGNSPVHRRGFPTHAWLVRHPRQALGPSLRRQGAERLAPPRADRWLRRRRRRLGRTAPDQRPRLRVRRLRLCEQPDLRRVERAAVLLSRRGSAERWCHARVPGARAASTPVTPSTATAPSASTSARATAALAGSATATPTTATAARAPQPRRTSRTPAAVTARPAAVSARTSPCAPGYACGGSVCYQVCGGSVSCPAGFTCQATGATSTCRKTCTNDTAVPQVDHLQHQRRLLQLTSLATGRRPLNVLDHRGRRAQGLFRHQFPPYCCRRGLDGGPDPLGGSSACLAGSMRTPNAPLARPRL